MILLALVTFEHGGDYGERLPLNCQGACGWMVAEAANSQDVTRVFRASLAAERLRLIEVDEVQVVESAAQVEPFDKHLAENMRNWEPRRPTVWGTLHLYTEDGGE